MIELVRGRLVYLPRTNFAVVAELVYAEVSKTSGSNPVSVRLRPTAYFRQNLVRGTHDSKSCERELMRVQLPPPAFCGTPQLC